MTDQNPDILSRDQKDEDAGDKVELQRVLGLPSCIAMLIGLVIGSGIFVNPTAIGRQLQSVGASLCMWLICGLYNMFQHKIVLNSKKMTYTDNDKLFCFLQEGVGYC